MRSMKARFLKSQSWMSNAPARILQNMRDALRGARVRPGAADEKLRLLTGFVLKPGSLLVHPV